MIRKFSGENQTAAIGDGGNDVSMIQAAHIGIGIVGKEGKQASLASDYSIQQFSHIGKLFLYHGRNSYLNTSTMSQFIIYRGVIFALMQSFYAVFFFASPVALFTGGLVVGYSCWYTMFPVFSLCVNKDLSKESLLLYPELYKELQKGRGISWKTFFSVLFVSLYQSSVISSLSLFVTLNFVDYVSLTFTTLCVVLLLSLISIVYYWHTLIIISVMLTVAIYPTFMLLQPAYYGMLFFVFLISLHTPQFYVLSSQRCNLRRILLQ
jgi:phospholipid-translocating ATPase